MLLSLAEAATAPLGLVGGKAKALGQLINFGAPVPPGFVVPPEANLHEAAAEIAERVAALGVPSLAVRSSGVGEDGTSMSWAGQFESYLNVEPEAVPRRIAQCRASGAAARVEAYANGAAAMPVAVVVQAMVEARVAGVAFSANPVTGNLHETVIESAYGLAEALVQGEVTPDNFIVHEDGSVTSEVAGASVSLSPAEINELAACAQLLQHRFGYPVDIEWAYHENQLFIVQARPITTIRT